MRFLRSYKTRNRIITLWLRDRNIFELIEKGRHSEVKILKFKDRQQAIKHFEAAKLH